MKLEKLDEQEALRFSRELISLYFEKRDMNTLACYIAEHTSWIGTGEGELCQSSEEAGFCISTSPMRIWNRSRDIIL